MNYIKSLKPLLDYTDSEIKDLARQVVTKGHVVLHEQKLTKQEHIEWCKRWGKMDRNEYFMNPEDAREISIVSGQRDENGKRIGMFGKDELQWHQNGSARHQFEDCIVSLYCVEECVDTVFSICSQVDCFADLPEERKEYFRQFDIKLDYVEDGIYSIVGNDTDDEKSPEHEINTGAWYYDEGVDRRPLVSKHHVDGREYLYFCVPFMVGAYKNGVELSEKEVDALYDELWDVLFKSKYMQHHVFRRGDILIMDQLHTIHRRSPIRFMDRMLWRTAFDYSNIKF